MFQHTAKDVDQLVKRMLRCDFLIVELFEGGSTEKMMDTLHLYASYLTQPFEYTK